MKNQKRQTYVTFGGGEVTDCNLLISKAKTQQPGEYVHVHASWPGPTQQLRLCVQSDWEMGASHQPPQMFVFLEENSSFLCSTDDVENYSSISWKHLFW